MPFCNALLSFNSVFIVTVLMNKYMMTNEENAEFRKTVCCGQPTISLRQADIVCFVPRRSVCMCNLHLDERAFRPAAPRAWNSLPSDVKQEVKVI